MLEYCREPMIYLRIAWVKISKYSSLITSFYGKYSNKRKLITILLKILLKLNTELAE